jgi:hypothetical protein
MQIKFPRRIFFASAITVFCIGAIATMQINQLSRLERSTTSQIDDTKKRTFREEEQQLRQKLTLLRQAPTFGFNNLVANWTFIDFLQYFGEDEARSVTGYSITPDFFEIIIKQDPRFIDIYPYLSSSVTLYAGQPETSIALIEKGLKSMSPKTHPDSFYLWRAKGTDELLFLDKAAAAQQSFEMAAAWARQSIKPEAPLVASNSLRTAEFLKQNPISKSAKASAWSNILTSAIDDDTRLRAVSAIRALGGDVAMDSQGQLRISLPKQD